MKLLIALLTLAIPVSGFSQTVTSKPYPRGIYLLTSMLPLGKSDIALIQTESFLDGVRIRADWKVIQPTSASTYNWKDVDTAISVAQAAGRKVGISVKAGAACPDWLYAEGCQFITMSGTTDKLPDPNDSHYIARWSQFIAAFGVRYDANPTVAYVIIGGLGDHMEWYYGKTPDQQALQAKYGASNVAAMWTTMAKTFIDAYATALPTTVFTGAVGDPFPGTTGNQAETNAVNYGVAKYPHRFGLSNSTLNANSTTSFYPNFAVNAYYQTQPTGFQMLWKQTGDATNRLKGNPASQSLDQSLTAGVKLHGRYVEIYSDDIANAALQPTIVSHRAQLIAIP